MTGSRFLLDTNIVIALFAGDAAVHDRLAKGADVSVPCIVLGELIFGARKSGKVTENVQRVTAFAAANVLLPCDLGTAVAYGEVKDALRVKGRPIPENDIWIAAVARQHGLTLVSRDDHFRHVDQLMVESWSQSP